MLERAGGGAGEGGFWRSGVLVEARGGRVGGGGGGAGGGGESGNCWGGEGERRGGTERGGLDFWGFPFSVVGGGGGGEDGGDKEGKGLVRKLKEVFRRGDLGLSGRSSR